ncbi:hypothetical protein [Nonomuraea sp. NPDC003804]|uniref:hypothetical protein n=1 Tax=Nonomuraea sp. NPDC003804 TaxID=3154547 RepID=UPI0033BBE30C
MKLKSAAAISGITLALLGAAPAQAAFADPGADPAAELAASCYTWTGSTNAKGTCSGGYVGTWYLRLQCKNSAGSLYHYTSPAQSGDGSVYVKCGSGQTAWNSWILEG